MYLQNRSKESGFVVVAIVFVFVVFLISFIAANKQRILDTVSYWQYQPTQEVSTIASRAGLNENGIFLFYASHPKLDGTQNFNNMCGRTENVTSILGCYKDGKIYVYDINEEKLDGILEVTSAHEMLHAAYVRLGEDERKNVDNLTQAEYEKVKDDKNLKTMMEYYEKTEPGQQANELHSIMATQFLNIDNKLENYYKRYFTSRGQVVSLYNKYIDVFNRLDAKQKSLSLKLKVLNKKIDQEVTAYNSSISQLNDDIQDFNTRATNGDFLTQSQFNNERLALDNRINELNNEKNSINEDINKYNLLLKQYNSIASSSKELYDSIDSTLAPAPSV